MSNDSCDFVENYAASKQEWGYNICEASNKWKCNIVCAKIVNINKNVCSTLRGGIILTKEKLVVELNKLDLKCLNRETVNKEIHKINDAVRDKNKALTN